MQPKFTIILGDKNRSSWSMRAWLILKQTSAIFDEHVIGLYKAETKDEILKYSPSGKVPLLNHNGHLIWESMAIAEYLNELFPEANLWPQDRTVRAYARSISYEMHSGYTKLRTLLPFCINETRTLPTSTELDIDIKRIESVWLECRAKFSNGGKYLFGTFTIADAMFAPIVLRFKTYNYSPTNPIVQDYCQIILDNKLIKEWISCIEG